LEFGNAMAPFEYGGLLWYNDPTTNAGWQNIGSLTANNLTLSTAEFSGGQLGACDWPVYYRGCAYCHAYIGSGTDKRMVMSYLYNPSKSSYSISFAVGG